MGLGTVNQVENTRFLDIVLRPVTEFLDEAVGSLVGGEELARTAEPLIQAIESIPGAGRVAVYLADAEAARFDFVAGPSFSAEEIDTLGQLLGTSRLECGNRQSAGIKRADTGAQSPQLRMFRLNVPGEQPAAVLVTTHDAGAGEREAVFDDFMDQIVQLAGIIVEDRRLRARTVEQQSVLEALTGTAPDAIIRIDRKGVVLDFLGRAEDLFGYEASEIVGQKINRLMPERHAERHDDYIEAFLRSGRRKLPDFGRRLQARRKDGSLFPVEIALSEIARQKSTEFIGIVHDISERVARESEIHDLRDALDRAARQSLLGELAAIIAHELSQPLTAIANYMDALELRLSRLDVAEKDELTDLARRAGAKARLGGEIVRRTRRMTLRGDSEREENDFHSAIGEAVALVSRTPEAQNVLIELHREGGSGTAIFDRVQIQQVVINLMTNALRAVEGCAERHVSITSRVGTSHVELIVEDSGPGIPEADRPRLFERFFTRHREGLGLGLAVVKTIADAHFGRIELDDAPGGGARFRLILPRRGEDMIEGDGHDVDQ